MMATIAGMMKKKGTIIARGSGSLPWMYVVGNAADMARIRMKMLI
jgi:hypothetical protein